jgi:hypothetical protein
MGERVAMGRRKGTYYKKLTEKTPKCNLKNIFWFILNRKVYK